LGALSNHMGQVAELPDTEAAIWAQCIAGIFPQIFNRPWQQNYWSYPKKFLGAKVGQTSSITMPSGTLALDKKSVMFLYVSCYLSCFWNWEVCENGNATKQCNFAAIFCSQLYVIKFFDLIIFVYCNYPYCLCCVQLSYVCLHGFGRKCWPTWGVYGCCGLVVWNIKFLPNFPGSYKINKNWHFMLSHQLSVTHICKWNRMWKIHSYTHCDKRFRQTIWLFSLSDQKCRR